MQDITSDKTSETDDKIKYHISNNLKGLNEQSRNYIKDIVVLINKEIGINKAKSKKIIPFVSKDVPEKELGFLEQITYERIDLDDLQKSI